jgi:hypothetical protein
MIKVGQIKWTKPLSFQTTETDLNDMFGAIGDVESVQSSQIAIPDDRKVSASCRWRTMPPRRKQSPSSMDRKSAGVSSLSTKHDQRKRGTSGDAVVAEVGADIRNARTIPPFPPTGYTAHS